MKVHIVGLGKLGLPVALALEHAGHEITGWDASETRRAQIANRDVPEASHEPHLAEYLAATKLEVRERVAGDTDIVLIAVQTPHQPEFEGVTPLDRPPRDFDYEHLKRAVVEVATQVINANVDPLVVVLSTCLPGTFERELRRLINYRWLYRGGAITEWPLRFAYHPLFIAMGSVIEDFRDPEFVLVGTDSRAVPEELVDLYRPLYGFACGQRPWQSMSITSAELTKVAYNAWLGYKLMLANGIAETCDRVGANCDDVMDTLKHATKRLVSPAYMTPGMGDGGGCHPRDQIALSWLADELGLSHDPYGLVIRAREAHAKWLADIWCDEADRAGLPMCLLGREYKANTTLTTGSHARLVEHYVRARGREPAAIHGFVDASGPACWFLAVPHDRFLAVQPTGVMIDPWGVCPEREGLRVVRPGRRV